MQALVTETVQVGENNTAYLAVAGASTSISTQHTASCALWAMGPNSSGWFVLHDR
jgi:hypothetical protein